jgi:hypothetical protein
MAQSWLPACVAVFFVACHSEPAPQTSAPESACPAGWLEAPPVDPSIAVPSAGARVVFHARATGTQNYACASAVTESGATYAWSLNGPEAVLGDCHAAPVGRHFASEAGPPEWQLSDGTYVVAHKTAAFAGTPGAVPWLLLTVDHQGGSSPLASARCVQRVRTSGGVPPSAPCDATQAGAIQKIPYEADYYFFAP